MCRRVLTFCVTNSSTNKDDGNDDDTCAMRQGSTEYTIEHFRRRRRRRRADNSSVSSVYCCLCICPVGLCAAAVSASTCIFLSSYTYIITFGFVFWLRAPVRARIVGAIEYFAITYWPPEKLRWRIAVRWQPTEMPIHPRVHTKYTFNDHNLHVVSARSRARWRYRALLVHTHT